jgi:uncharacterized membrane protein
MIWLVLGLLLWAAAHFFNRAAPKLRRGMGDSGKALVAASSIVGIVLMVIGYRMAEPVALWSLPLWAWHLNNLLMVVAVLLFGLGHSRSRLNRAMRHPMLMAVTVWAVAHLLVNGDVPSLVLFGGMGVWAVAEMIVINRVQPRWVPPPKGNLKGDAIYVVGAIVAFVVIVLVHSLIGPSPLPPITA